jgi:hypothetical protein
MDTMSISMEKAMKQINHDGIFIVMYVELFMIDCYQKNNSF